MLGHINHADASASDVYCITKNFFRNTVKLTVLLKVFMRFRSRIACHHI